MYILLSLPVFFCVGKFNFDQKIVLNKGQKKSKCFFLSRRLLQKMNEQILLYYYETSGRLVFIRFLEEIEDTKKTFRNHLTFTKVIIS